MRKRVLFTIPFAGGNRYVFKDFQPFLADDFRLHPLELAGRGDRISQDLMKELYAIRDDLFSKMQDHLEDEYIIYGHSMGGILAYLLTLMIEDQKLPLPTRVIISGRNTPTKKPKKIRHLLAKEAFKDSLRELEGTANEVLDHPEIFDFFEPILRADFEAIETYNFEESRKLNTPLTILHGQAEKNFDEEGARAWQHFTHDAMDFHSFSGGHFFIYDHIEAICDIIKKS